MVLFPAGRSFSVYYELFLDEFATLDVITA
jgi:hypothetical protein